MLKEIKEGQPLTPVTLKQQAGNSQQKPIKYCGICSCNSNHTDECLQIQEDNTIAVAQNFVDFTIKPPNNKQYRVQGPNGQPVRWNPSPQQLAQFRQPYISTMPQHTQNVRYQSPYLCQQFPSTNDPPNKYEEGFLNAIHDGIRSEDKSEDTDNEEAEQHLYELLLKMAESKDERGADNVELMDFCEEYGSDHEDDETDQERETEDEWKKETQSNKEKFCINTISDMRKDEEELPAKCEDPSACLVTCKIRGVDIHEYLCDPRASDFHILKPTPKEKKGKPQVLLGRPFLKIGGFEQDYHDDTFKFSAGKTTERFQIVKKGKDHSLQKDDGRMRGKVSAHIEMIEAMARGWTKMLKEDIIQKDEEEELEESFCADQKSQKKGPDKTYEKPPAEYPSVTGMLDEIEQILYHNKGADTHLIRNNSKWK
ncbi:hypothetical protein PIB30_021995 [Stylosanthes scabra]|uniref:Uncharacterized protein n=1 Tax=Stylosanthes scabra TaxID=79078 RepID=A0ABU6W709_9FABA|nr:hypothetical protein [Stylosanthes scabra]